MQEVVLFFAFHGVEVVFFNTVNELTLVVPFIELGRLIHILGPRNDNALCPYTLFLKGFINLKEDFLVHLSEKSGRGNTFFMKSGPRLTHCSILTPTGSQFMVSNSFTPMCDLLPNCKTTRYGINSIIYQSILNWNEIQTHYKEIELSTISKAYIKQLAYKFFLNK